MDSRSKAIYSNPIQLLNQPVDRFRHVVDASITLAYNGTEPEYGGKLDLVGSSADLLESINSSFASSSLSNHNRTSSSGNLDPHNHFFLSSSGPINWTYFAILTLLITFTLQLLAVTCWMSWRERCHLNRASSRSTRVGSPTQDPEVKIEGQDQTSQDDRPQSLSHDVQK